MGGERERELFIIVDRQIKEYQMTSYDIIGLYAIPNSDTHACKPVQGTGFLQCLQHKQGARTSCITLSNQSCVTKSRGFRQFSGTMHGEPTDRQKEPTDNTYVIFFRTKLIMDLKVNTRFGI